MAVLIFILGASCWGQTELPDAPVPQMVTAAAMAAEGGGAGQTFPPTARRERGIGVPGLQPSYMPVPAPCVTNRCSKAEPQISCCQPDNTRFGDYLKDIAVPIYTPEDLGRMAVQGFVDPFNLLTIGWTSALSVATDPHSPFGPGMKGFAKLSGVAVTQDMTGEFIGTFLIPSVTHQDPFYHRMPNAPLPWRIAHCVYQVFWTHSDTGKGMPNYATIVGVPAEEAIGSAYIPYRQIGFEPSAERVLIDWGTAPIGNLVTEFVPDVARHINIRVVLLQRIINRVAIEEAQGPQRP